MGGWSYGGQDWGLGDLGCRGPMCELSGLRGAGLWGGDLGCRGAGLGASGSGDLGRLALLGAEFGAKGRIWGQGLRAGFGVQDLGAGFGVQGLGAGFGHSGFGVFWGVELGGFPGSLIWGAGFGDLGHRNWGCGVLGCREGGFGGLGLDLWGGGLGYGGAMFGGAVWGRGFVLQGLGFGARGLGGRFGAQEGRVWGTRVGGFGVLWGRGWGG